MTQKVFVAVGIPLNQNEFKKMQSLLLDGPSGSLEGYSPMIILDRATSTNYLCFNVWAAGGYDFDLLSKFRSLSDLDDAMTAAQVVAARFHLSIDHHIVIYVDGVLTFIDVEFVFGLAYRLPGVSGDVSGPCLRSRAIPAEDAPALEYVGGMNFGVFKFFGKAKLHGMGLYRGWTWGREEIDADEEDWDLYLPYGSEGGPRGGTEWLAIFEVVKSGTPIQQFQSLVTRTRDSLQEIAQKLTGTFGVDQVGLILWHDQSSSGTLPRPPLFQTQERLKKIMLDQGGSPNPTVPSREGQVDKNPFAGGFQIKKGAARRKNAPSNVK